MKHIFGLLLALTAGNGYVQAQHSFNKLWQTDSVLAIPESALLDKSNHLLYVSLIDGQANEKDGKGGIAKVGTDGKIIQLDWITGLNAPKGSGIYKGLLYVADADEVVVIDINKATVLKKIPVAGAVFLNDVTIDKNGTVYVSDSRANRIYMLQNDQPSIFLENTKNVNGLLAVGDDLYYLAYGELYKTDASKQSIKIAGGMEVSTDGLQQIDDHAFLVSSWIGSVYYVTTDGKTELLLDTKGEKINTADLSFDAENKIAYIPTFLKKSVMAYQLK